MKISIEDKLIDYHFGDDNLKKNVGLLPNRIQTVLDIKTAFTNKEWENTPFQIYGKSTKFGIFEELLKKEKQFHIRRIATIINDNDLFHDPIIIWKENDQHRVIDGSHRLWAHYSMGKTEANAICLEKKMSEHEKETLWNTIEQYKYDIRTALTFLKISYYE